MEGTYACYGYCLNESPSEKEGKWAFSQSIHPAEQGLNESPSEKEGKYGTLDNQLRLLVASMKVPPKRKGNVSLKNTLVRTNRLNESPSEKEGKWVRRVFFLVSLLLCLNESPSEKEGKCALPISFTIQSEMPQ